MRKILELFKESPNTEEWQKETAKRWNDMDWKGRQHWLIQIGKLGDVYIHSHSMFSELPKGFDEALAKEWGIFKV